MSGSESNGPGQPGGAQWALTPGLAIRPSNLDPNILAFANAGGGGANLGAIQNAVTLGNASGLPGGTRLDPTNAQIYTQYTNWLAAQSNAKSTTAAADQLMATQPGRQGTILTPQTAGKPVSLLGGR